MAPPQPKSGIFVGLNKGHVVTKRELAPRPSRRKGLMSYGCRPMFKIVGLQSTIVAGCSFGCPGCNTTLKRLQFCKKVNAASAIAHHNPQRPQFDCNTEADK